MNIDIHAHFNSNDLSEIKTYVENCEKNNFISMMSGGLRYGGHDYLPNEEVIALCKKFPQNLLPMAKVDLWNDCPNLDIIKKYVDMGVKGFKFIYPYYSYDHDIYLSAYELIEKLKLPCLFHTGDYRASNADVKYKLPVLENMSPIKLDRIARAFPDLKIIAAHMGTKYFREIVACLIKTHENIYFDLAGCGNFLGVSAQELADLLAPNVYIRNENAEYFKKMIFGSDSYITIPIIQTEAINAYKNLLFFNKIDIEIQDGIFGKTVLSWI